MNWCRCDTSRITRYGVLRKLMDAMQISMHACPKSVAQFTSFRFTCDGILVFFPFSLRLIQLFVSAQSPTVR